MFLREDIMGSLSIHKYKSTKNMTQTTLAK